METLRSHFHLIAYSIRFVGSVLVAIGGLRVVRAPSQAARRAPAPSPNSANGRSAARGLADFYRISGALTILAGVLLLLMTFVAW